MVKRNKIIIILCCVFVLVVSIIQLSNNYSSKEIIKALDNIKSCEKIDILYNDDNNIEISDREIVDSIKQELNVNLSYATSHNKKIEKCKGNIYCTIKFNSTHEDTIIMNIYLFNDITESYDETYYTMIDGNKCLIEIKGHYFKSNKTIDLKSMLAKEHM